MKKISSLISVIIILLGIGVFFYHKDIIKYVFKTYIIKDSFNVYNAYTKGIDYSIFKRTNNYIPKNKEEFINVIYTIIDNGIENFSFFCDYDCEKDVVNIGDDEILNIINNYVHPFNSYKSFNISIDNFGIIRVNIDKNYTNYEKDAINSKVIEIIKNNITNDMNDYEKVKVIHDYIVNNTIYDKEESLKIDNNILDNINSHKAYNVLINGIGVCNGYTDALSIFLNYLNINNFKVSTNNHIWNTLYINNSWQHIDITWDDPVTSDGSNILIHDYFIITTNELLNKDMENHNFNKSLYKELN